MPKAKLRFASPFKAVRTGPPSFRHAALLFLAAAIGALTLMAAFSAHPVLAEAEGDATVADGEPVWSADMSVVDLGNGAIGAVRPDLFSNVGGSADLEAQWFWYYAPYRQLILDFYDVVPGDEALTLLAGDLALPLQPGNSNYSWDDVDVDWEDGQTIAVSIILTSAAVAPQPNSTATGQPTISGTAQVGETLTADVSGIADADGLTIVSYSYQWLSSRDTEIQGAMDSTYTLVSADEGKTIKVRVSFTDDANNQETLTSEATAVVAARPNTPATGLPTITGTAQVDETLTGNYVGHRRRRRAEQRQLQLPVDRRRHRHTRREEFYLHPEGRRRRGEDHQGKGVLHRRRR